MGSAKLPMQTAAEGLSAPAQPVLTPLVGGPFRRTLMSNRWNQREKHVGAGNSAVPPVRPCVRPLSRGERPKEAPPAAATSFGPLEPWLAMDEDLFVRRVSAHFSRLARRPTDNYVGQPLFAVLATLGVSAHTLDEIFELATAGQTCFVELPRGSLGRRNEQYALEIRPIPAQAGWVIRYVAVAWRHDQAASAGKTQSAPLASPLEFPESKGSTSRNDRSGSDRFRSPGRS